GEVDEGGDVDGARPAWRDRIQLRLLDGHHDTVHFAALDDVLEVDFLAGPLVEPLVADAIGGAALVLVELDGVVFGGGVQPDRDRHQAEVDRTRPDLPRHGPSSPWRAARSR